MLNVIKSSFGPGILSVMCLGRYGESVRFQEPVNLTCTSMFLPEILCFNHSEWPWTFLNLYYLLTCTMVLKLHLFIWCSTQRGCSWTVNRHSRRAHVPKQSLPSKVLWPVIITTVLFDTHIFLIWLYVACILLVCHSSLLVKRTPRSSGYRPDCEHLSTHFTLHHTTL